MANQNLLFLAHRIPYPPNKGDKIRSYHFLKHLAERYKVFLATFIDDPGDHQHIATVNALCASAHYQPLNPLLAKLKSLQGLLTGQPLTVPYYHSPTLRAWVGAAIKEHRINKALVFSGAMAQFIDDWDSLEVVVDFVDVDSDKWRQYADNQRGLARRIYAREADYLLRYERAVAAKAKASLFVSDDEARLFRRLSGADPARVGFVSQGVDTGYFLPEQPFPCPFAEDGQVLVFTGAMDYWANIDAVVWFAEQVMPILATKAPAARFYIVGGKPAQPVLRLAKSANVVVTGQVADVRPYLAHARLAVAPLRIARGIQNKVLEAMAMAKPVVATPAAMEGIAMDVHPGLAVHVTDDPAAMADTIAGLLAQHPAPAPQNRAFVEQRFSWRQNLRKLTEWLES